MFNALKIVFFSIIGLAMCWAANTAQATEGPQEWEFIVPAGVVYNPPFDPAPRLTTLEGKTIALRWNSKPNGDVLLDYLAEQLIKAVPSVKIVKVYAERPETNMISTGYDVSQKMADITVSFKPDLVIESSGD